MLDASTTRALSAYMLFAFPVALLCAIPYFDRDGERPRPRLAWLLVGLAPLHVLFPLAALGLTADRRVRRAAAVGAAVSTAVLVTVLVTF